MHTAPGFSVVIRLLVISDFQFVWTVDARKKKKKKKKKMEKSGYIQQHEKYRYHLARPFILW